MIAMIFFLFLARNIKAFPVKGKARRIRKLEFMAQLKLRKWKMENAKLKMMVCALRTN